MFSESSACTRFRELHSSALYREAIEVIPHLLRPFTLAAVTSFVGAVLFSHIVVMEATVAAESMTTNAASRTRESAGISNDGDAVTKATDEAASSSRLNLDSRINYMTCGPNALYMFLRLHHINVEFERLLARVDVKDTGVSMQEMCETATDFGLQTNVYRIERYDQLAHIRPPFIAHIGPRENGTAGHYVVVTNITRDQLQAIDGATGYISNFRRTGFMKGASGYVLIARHDSAEGRAQIVSAVCIVLPWLVLAAIYPCLRHP